MSVTEFAEWIGIVRDGVLLLLLVVLVLVLLMLYFKVSGILGSVKRFGDMVSTVSDSVKPVAASSGVVFSVGKVLVFLLGLIRKRKGGEGNGRQ